MINLKKLWRNFGYAFKGIKIVFFEQIFFIQILIACIVLIAIFSFPLKITEQAILILCIIIVLSFELINSALERFLDLLNPEPNHYVRIIKDIIAGAVLIASIGSAIIGTIILSPYIVFWFSNNYILQQIISNLDNSMANFAISLRSDKLTPLIKFLTFLGDWQAISFVSLLTIIYLWFKKNKQLILVYLTNLIGAGVIVVLLKNYLARPRPSLENALIIEHGYSLPSGHSAFAFIIYGLITYFVFTIAHKKWLKIFTLIIAIFLILGIGFSRIYLGVHFLSDVLTSYLIGSLFLFSAHIFLKK